MIDFTAINMKTGNLNKISLCELGFCIVENSKIIRSGSYLIKPIGGHTTAQTKIHKIADADTMDKPLFNAIFPEIESLFSKTIIGNSIFDKQVLDALSDYYSLNMAFYYLDLSSIARDKIPGLYDYKLKTVAKYLNLPKNIGHRAIDDATICANITINLGSIEEKYKRKSIYLMRLEYIDILKNIIASGHLTYIDAYKLLCWLVDHLEVTEEHFEIYGALKNFCSDNKIDTQEEIILFRMIKIEIEKIYRMLTHKNLLNNSPDLTIAST